MDQASAGGLVAHDLDAVLDDLRRELGLEVAFNDPAVATFGLRNAVLPVGTQFVEVVSPTRGGHGRRPATRAARWRRRLHGDLPHRRARTGAGPHRGRSASARSSTPTSTATRSCSCIRATPAGRSWRSTSSRAATIRTDRGCRPGPTGSAPFTPTSSTASRASSCASPMPTRSRRAGARSSTCPVDDGAIALDNATVRFVEGTGGLVAVDVRGGAHRHDSHLRRRLPFLTVDQRAALRRATASMVTAASSTSAVTTYFAAAL